MKVYRLRKDAKLPVRAHKTDAGMDLFYCPTKLNHDLYDEGFGIPPGTSKLIPTGLKFEVPENHMLEIKNKSGIAFKRQLVVGACVVDSGYDGEVYVNLHNIGTGSQVIEPGEKIAQAVLIPIVTCDVEEVEEDVLNESTTRGEGGFGSTGNR